MNLQRTSQHFAEANRLFEKVVPALKTAKATLEDREQNLVCIDGSSLEFPEAEWSRDFEVRVVLDFEKPETINKFKRLLPKRFENAASFWLDYVDSLNKAFCQAFDVRFSQVRLTQVSDNECTFFHTDNVLVRLFQTVQGLGTEYLSEENLNRDGIGSGSNSNIVIDPAKIQQAQEKDILLMRGEKWHKSNGLVHRSPPIEHLGLKRLYLSIDAIEDLSDPRY